MRNSTDAQTVTYRRWKRPFAPDSSVYQWAGPEHTSVTLTIGDSLGRKYAGVNGSESVEPSGR